MHVRPEGDAAEDRATDPENPLMPVTVMVDVPVPPVGTVTLVGLALSWKFVTLTVTVVVRDWPLFVPVTATV